jgi:hypothetical protein
MEPCHYLSLLFVKSSLVSHPIIDRLSVIISNVFKIVLYVEVVDLDRVYIVSINEILLQGLAGMNRRIENQLTIIHTKGKAPTQTWL